MTDLWRYGLMGMPLAFASLPLYVQLPAHHAARFGVSLTALGLLLMAVRLLDAVVDPWLGQTVDRWLGRSPRPHGAVMWAVAVVLWLGFTGVFFPPLSGSPTDAAVWWWTGAGLVITSFAYSWLTIAHQAWGARLGKDDQAQVRVVAWREGPALAGVLVASVLPATAGMGATAMCLGGLLLLGCWQLSQGPQPRHASEAPGSAMSTGAGGGLAAWRMPWQWPAFRRLLLIYAVSGLASAVPATLVLFFIRDRLGAPQWEARFLLFYFLAAGLAVPMWTRAVQRLGLANAWGLAMTLSVLVFAWAATLGEGDVWAFAGVCLLSGLSLGADLCLPAALLVGVLRQHKAQGHLAGRCFGWWNLVTKANLAVAAGVALPALGALGYAPGVTSDEGLSALTLVYCILPCVLKLLAAGLLWVSRSHFGTTPYGLEQKGTS